MLRKNEPIVYCLNAKMSLQETAKATGRSIPIICKVKKIMKIVNDKQQQ